MTEPFTVSGERKGDRGETSELLQDLQGLGLLVSGDVGDVANRRCRNALCFKAAEDGFDLVLW